MYKPFITIKATANSLTTHPALTHYYFYCFPDSFIYPPTLPITHSPTHFSTTHSLITCTHLLPTTRSLTHYSQSLTYPLLSHPLTTHYSYTHPVLIHPPSTQSSTQCSYTLSVLIHPPSAHTPSAHTPTQYSVTHYSPVANRSSAFLSLLEIEVRKTMSTAATSLTPSITRPSSPVTPCADVPAAGLEERDTATVGCCSPEEIKS